MKERFPGQEPQREEKSESTSPTRARRRSLAAARAGAIEPAAVELLPAPGGAVVVMTLASEQLAAAMRRRHDAKSARWRVRHAGAVDGRRRSRAGSGYSPIARYELSFDAGRRPTRRPGVGDRHVRARGGARRGRPRRTGRSRPGRAALTRRCLCQALTWRRSRSRCERSRPTRCRGRRGDSSQPRCREPVANAPSNAGRRRTVSPPPSARPARSPTATASARTATPCSTRRRSRQPGRPRPVRAGAPTRCRRRAAQRPARLLRAARTEIAHVARVVVGRNPARMRADWTSGKFDVTTAPAGATPVVSLFDPSLVRGSSSNSPPANAQLLLEPRRGQVPLITLCEASSQIRRRLCGGW